jgi:cellulose synthase (UDP-forming)
MSLDVAHKKRRSAFLRTRSPRPFFIAAGCMAVVYFYALVFRFTPGNAFLYALLVAGEVFHLWQVFTFLYTVYDTSYEHPSDPRYAPAVDVFITVAGEPVAIVEQTARAASEMHYPNKRVYLLNDGYVANKDNWQDMEVLAAKLGIYCITRTTPGGAKAGNINHALDATSGTLVAVFDADHIPHADFLEKTVPHFADQKVGFVQTPQYYRNYAENIVTESSWEQQELFFGAICRGKNRLNSVTMCGTNMLISRQALSEVGGMVAESIAEDFVTGLLIHARGYSSVYVPEVLAEGLATEDLLSYTKQQFRWARGALDVMFRYNPLLLRGLTFAQRIQYLASASFYVSGVIVFIDALLPLIFFFTGLVPVQISGMLLATIFLPYFCLILYSIQLSSNFTLTFRSVAFSMGAWWIHVQALLAALTGRRNTFSITPKEAQRGNFIPLVIPHILYMVATVVGVAYALSQTGLTPSLINNTAWALVNVVVLWPFVWAAMPARFRSAYAQERASHVLIANPASV